MDLFGFAASVLFDSYLLYYLLLDSGAIVVGKEMTMYSANWIRLDTYRYMGMVPASACTVCAIMIQHKGGLSSPLQFPSLWLSTLNRALHGPSFPPFLGMSNTIYHGLLPPLPLVALDLRGTDGLSAQTPIDMGVEPVVVRKRPRTQRTLPCHGARFRSHPGAVW